MKCNGEDRITSYNVCYTKLLRANSNNVLDADEVSASNYICDGAPGPGIVWQDVTGTSVQAASNTGYLANNATEPVLITLPATPRNNFV